MWRMGPRMSNSQGAPCELVRFLNVDVDLSGVLDPVTLVGGFGDAIVVLHEEEAPLGHVISFELTAMHLTLPDTITSLIEQVNALPAEARALWDSATRRVFNVGVQAGLGPYRTEWALGVEALFALASINAELVLTIYGADRVGGRSSAP